MHPPEISSASCIRSHLLRANTPHRGHGSHKHSVDDKGQVRIPYQLDPAQTLRATSALVKKIQSDETARAANTTKRDLLADESSEAEAGDDDAVPIWLTLTTKKHIVDKKQLKPGKIVLSHPSTAPPRPTFRIYKDIVADTSFPPQLASKINRVIGITKLKAKYKSYESRRQLFGEYDIFLADDRIVTYLPTTLGKVFYGTGAKRPVPVTLEGKKQTKDENGAKLLKISEGGSKKPRAEAKPESIAKEIERAIGAALVHLSPGTNVAVKVGKASWPAEHTAENVETVVKGLTDKYVTKGWRNVKSVHVKGPNTTSLPIWLADELWEDEADVLDKAPELQVGKKEKKRKRSALTESKVEKDEVEAAAPEKKRKSLDAAEAEKPKKKRKSDGMDGQVNDKAKRKDVLKRQKEEARKAVAASA
ncbi:proteasome-interacting protein cic1 [Taxawa tesnikishii (nom. ined.)]|nr:proteasome-interacting protein cic1 [Dothideales sp. JES 119]